MCGKFVLANWDLLGQIPENGRKMANARPLFQALYTVLQHINTKSTLLYTQWFLNIAKARIIVMKLDSLGLAVKPLL